MRAAPTPLLGPDSTVRTGSRSACLKEITPPLDWVMWGGTVTPSRVSPTRSRLR
jgi:hypothetical protein